MGEEEKSKLITEFAKNPKLVMDFMSNDIEEKKTSRDRIAKREEVKLAREIALNKMRARWSNWLLGCIVAIVGFDLLLAALLGFKVIVFDNENIVYAFLIENLVKIAGLSYVVVAAIFDKSLLKLDD